MTTHYFTADFAGQTLGMGLPACRPLQDLPTGHITLDAAAALGYAERWLPELEAWLAHGLFPSLCPQQPNWGDHWVLTRAPSPHVGGRDAAQIHLPWLALEKLKTPYLAGLGKPHIARSSSTVSISPPKSLSILT
jgi:hypothetical protein